MAGVAEHLKGFPRRYDQLKMPWFTQMQILDRPALELNPLNFHFFFFDFPPAKRVFVPDRQKSPEFYAIKNVKIKKEGHCQPAPPTPKKSKKSILIFANFFRFLC
jgi:hypothetical protein